jgi:hypothetical protein
MKTTKIIAVSFLFLSSLSVVTAYGWRRGWGGGVGVGIGAGLATSAIVGSAIAASRPRYYDAPYYSGRYERLSDCKKALRDLEKENRDVIRENDNLKRENDDLKRQAPATR